MKLITRFELASRGDHELHALYRETFNALAQSGTASTDRRNCLASLENITAEIATRILRP